MQVMASPMLMLQLTGREHHEKQIGMIQAAD
jgi:hypothetical protein